MENKKKIPCYWHVTALSICRLPASAIVVPPPDSQFFSVSKIGDECSVVCSAGSEPDHCQKIESGWVALSVLGPLDFALTGILASIAEPLARAKIPLFALSTFDTDYILIKHDAQQHAQAVLEKSGNIAFVSSPNTKQYP